MYLITASKARMSKGSQFGLVSLHCPEEMKCLFFMDAVTSIKQEKPTTELKMLKPSFLKDLVILRHLFSNSEGHFLQQERPLTSVLKKYTLVRIHNKNVATDQGVDYTLRNS